MTLRAHSYWDELEDSLVSGGGVSFSQAGLGIGFKVHRIRADNG